VHVTDKRTYEERHASASETFARFMPGVEPDRVAMSFGRRLGPLGGFAFDVVGDMWNRPQLSRRDRSLLVISTLAAQARDEELVSHTQIGLRHGLTRTEIEEVVVHVAAYAGFPAAMAASRHIDAGLREAEGVERLSDRAKAVEKTDDQRDHDAADVLSTITGGRSATDPAEALAAIEASLGGLGTVAFRWAFGEIWSRPQLSRRDRSVVVISILTNLGAERELGLHVGAGLNHGLTRDEIEEVITHVSLYAGIPRAVAAMRAAREVFTKRDTAKP
jgi:4-carboxymuconolactone decarboxylase